MSRERKLDYRDVEDHSLAVPRVHEFLKHSITRPLKKYELRKRALYLNLEGNQYLRQEKGAKIHLYTNVSTPRGQ